MREMFNKKKIAMIFSAFLVVEILSLVGNVYPFLGEVFFAVAALVFLGVALYDLRYGLLLIFGELFVGSQGYLFSWEAMGQDLSIRIVMWLLLLAVWGGKLVSRMISHSGSSFKREFKILQSPYFTYILILALFIGWGILNAFISGNSVGNIILDVNGWFYLALIVPLYEIAGGDKKFFPYLFQLFFTAMVWISIKSLFLLFIFSHNLHSWTEVLYTWVRDTGVGEITDMQSGIVRVFFQSHIFVVIAFFISLLVFNKFIPAKKLKQWSRKELKNIVLIAAGSILFFTVILISFSRSFWAGSVVAFVVFLGIIGRKYNWKRVGFNVVFMVGVAIISIGLVAGIINLPGVGNAANVNTADSISERAGSLSGEAAVSSRWNLLPRLWDKVTEAPVLGQGFGTTVTYHSNDPRVLQRTVDGEYTTYVFEWGWLDIWLKMGFVGFFCYAFLLGKVVLDGLMERRLFNSLPINGIIIGIVILGAVNFFTPYLNHPLGLGFLILALALIDREQVLAG